MTTTAAFILTGPRWSSAVICARRAVYEGTGAPREPISPQLARIFRRGRFIGEAISRDIAASLEEQGRPPGEAEREIPWPRALPIGVGHADHYVPDVKTLIEVVSTADGDLPSHKPKQLTGYVLNDPEAEAGLVLSIDPTTYEERVYPIDVEGLRAEVEEIQARVVHGLKTGKLPGRAMTEAGELVESPTQRPCFDCPFRRTCWTGHEPYPVGQLPEKVHADLLRLADLEDRAAADARVAELPEIKEEIGAIREKLRGLLLPGADYRGGDIGIKRSEVKPSRRFSLAKAETAGHAIPDHLLPFVSESGGHDRWHIRRLES